MRFLAPQNALLVRVSRLVRALSAANVRCDQAAQEHAQKVHDTALRFVHRFDLSDREVRRVNQRINHRKSLLAELR
jgi:hypothetical protein